MMQRWNKRIRSMAATGSMLLCLVLLAQGVMRLPQVYGGYSDRRTLNRPEYMENDVKAYANEYASMEEKLQDIVYYQSRFIELQEVYIPAAADTEVSDGELTGYLQEEIERLYRLGILYGTIDLSEYRLVYREMYNIYPGNGDRLRGRISYWFLNYESAEGLLMVKMDTEYHKLYEITVEGTDARSECVAQEEYLIGEMLNAGKSGRETAMGMMDKLSQGYAGYFGITVSKETEESRAEAEIYKYREQIAGDLSRAIETVIWMIKEGGLGWKFSVENGLAIKEDGSLLRFRANYQSGGVIFSTGIQWGI